MLCTNPCHDSLSDYTNGSNYNAQHSGLDTRSHFGSCWRSCISATSTPTLHIGRRNVGIITRCRGRDCMTSVNAPPFRAQYYLSRRFDMAQSQVHGQILHDTASQEYDLEYEGHTVHVQTRAVPFHQPGIEVTYFGCTTHLQVCCKECLLDKAKTSVVDRCNQEYKPGF